MTIKIADKDTAINGHALFSFPPGHASVASNKLAFNETTNILLDDHRDNVNGFGAAANAFGPLTGGGLTVTAGNYTAQLLVDGTVTRHNAVMGKGIGPSVM